MKKSLHRGVGSLCFLLATTLWASALRAQDASVTVRVSVEHAKAAKSSADMGMKAADSANVVVWLVPLEGQAAGPSAVAHEPYRLVQKNKQFEPHVLVVPAGTSVEFPNLDPFFHNVFSLFNGKRFDLGLYEAGSRRSVRFDREGVSYIFCNIHPEMGAVVVSLRSPWYGVSSSDGLVTIRNLPAGAYRLHVWAENVSAEEMLAAERQVRVESGPVQIEAIRLSAVAHAMDDHKNKFGDAYKATPPDPY
jgi:plastocyanin